ncbi:MAG: 30S ribosomal protein S15 [Candidatus Aenigmarchaeota archaeon]|nr:30S ribosomal protein S15 [Candidatus Aenigmarchaeota archaeon]
MARMYSRRKGKSGSHKPIEKKALWVSYKPPEIEDIIVKLAKKGLPASQIGQKLRDDYGVPYARSAINKKISRVLKEHSLAPSLPDDIYNLLKRAVNLHGHMAKNKRDYTSKRGLEITESKIRKLAKYYKSQKALPPEWKYNIEQARLLVRQ